jgi:hypothetical protein
MGGQSYAPVTLVPKKRASGTLEQEAGFQSCLYISAKKKSLIPAGNRPPNRPAHGLVTVLSELSVLHVLKVLFVF